MKHSAIYVRVSSKQQDHASQLPDLERWVAAHDGAVDWYRDKFTGKTMDRPGMEKLLADLRAGKVERIVVWRLDRLGRTTRGLCQLFDELGERKVDLVSLKDGFSLASPAGRLHARILACGGRVRNRGPGRAGGCRSSRCTAEGKEVGRQQEGLAVESHGRSGCRHPRNARGRKDALPKSRGSRGFPGRWQPALTIVNPSSSLEGR